MLRGCRGIRTLTAMGLQPKPAARQDNRGLTGNRTLTFSLQKRCAPVNTMCP